MLNSFAFKKKKGNKIKTIEKQVQTVRGSAGGGKEDPVITLSNGRGAGHLSSIVDL